MGKGDQRMNRKFFSLGFVLLLTLLSTIGAPVQAGSQQSPPAAPLDYSITGRVTDGSGNGVEGVTVYATLNFEMVYLPLLIKPAGSSTASDPDSSRVTAAGQTAASVFSTVTDAVGNYTFASLIRGSYTLTVIKDGILFTPSSRIVALPVSSSQDFQVQILPPVVPPTTEPIEPATNQYLQSVSADGAEFTFSQTTSELQSLVPGDIIASNPTAAAPNGYLRKVVSVTNQGGTVVVDTEPAVLEEAVQDGSVYIHNTLSPAQVAQSSMLPGVRMLPAPTAALTTFYFEVEDVVLYDDDGNLATEDDQVKANGSIEFEMDYEFYLNIQWFELRNLTFANRNSVRDTIEIVMECELAKLEDETILASQTFTPLTVMIGPVPVVIVPRLDVVVGVDGSVKVGISSSVSHELSMRTGVEYVNPAGWRPIAQLTNQITFTPPHPTLEATIKGYYGLRFNLYLYGAAGPYVKVTPFLELKITPLETPWWVLYWGLDVPAGFRVIDELHQIGAWFVLELDDYEVSAIGVKNVLAQAQTGNHTPNWPSSPSPANGTTQVDLAPVLSWIGGDPDGDAVTYDVFLEVGDSSPEILVSENQVGTSFTPGNLSANTTYYWQINPTDSYGWSNAGPVWSFTTGDSASLPGAFNKVSPVNEAANQPTSLTLDWEDSSGATSYSHCYDTTDDNACTGWSDPVTASQATISGLQNNTTYYWQVRATNSDGTTYANGGATAYWIFTTGNGSINPGEMVFVPAGEFPMGCDPAHNGGYICTYDELPLHTVYLDAFYIDKYEVTNARYAQCVTAGSCTAPHSYGSYTGLSYYDNPAYTNYPVIHVDWYQARDFCAWEGKRLPSEAEWEKATRGTSVRAFPWGDPSPDCSLANFYNNGYCVGDTSQIDSYPDGASPYGALDMAGNVWEWVNDWYANDYYSSSPHSNPPGPATGTIKVMRGGSWRGNDGSLRVANRHYYGSLTGWYYDVGFRCGASPAP